MTLKKNQTVSAVMTVEQAGVSNPARYRTRTLPAAGAIAKDSDALEKQISLDV
jgi:DNA gyrase subunit A